jgi:hypothetical protein
MCVRPALLRACSERERRPPAPKNCSAGLGLCLCPALTLGPGLGTRGSALEDRTPDPTHRFLAFVQKRSPLMAYMDRTMQSLVEASDKGILHVPTVQPPRRASLA